jgi:predicted RNase H-like HicB family nuclease
MPHNTIRPSDLILRCYAERENSYWVAVCVDLNLAVQAETFKEAHNKLTHQIQWYIYDAMAGEDKKFGSALMKRKAPLPIQLRYHWLMVMSKFRSLRKKFRMFTELQPLSPQIPSCA